MIDQKLSIIYKLTKLFEKEGIFYAIRAFPKIVEQGDPRDIDIAVFKKDFLLISEIIKNNFNTSNIRIIREVRGISTLAIYLLIKNKEDYTFFSLDFVDPIQCNRWFLPNTMKNDELNIFIKNGIRYIDYTDNLIILILKIISENYISLKKLQQNIKYEGINISEINTKRIILKLSKYLSIDTITLITAFLTNDGNKNEIENIWKKANKEIKIYLIKHPLLFIIHFFRKIYFSLIRFFNKSYIFFVDFNLIDKKVFFDKFNLISKYMKSTCIICSNVNIFQSVFKIIEAKRNWGIIFITKNHPISFFIKRKREISDNVLNDLYKII